MAADAKADDDSVRDMYRNIDEDLNVLWTEENGKVIRYVDEERYLSALPLIEDFVTAIADSDEDAFVDDGEGRHLALPLGESFKLFNGFLAVRCEEYVFSEKVELFFAACKQFDMGAEHFRQLDLTSIVDDTKTLWQRCNAFVAYIREECHTRRFKKRVYDRAHKTKVNYESCVAYVNRLFAVKSRLLVMRVDLGYQQACFSETGLIKVREDFDKLLNNRRSNKLFAEMFGYIWKLEYGVQKGYHYHCVFFFLGATVKNDSYYANLIGKYWVNTITGGTGTMYNCNAQKNKYRYIGIGMIDRSDLEKRANLLKAIRYLMKKEQYLLMRLTKKTSIVWQG